MIRILHCLCIAFALLCVAAGIPHAQQPAGASSQNFAQLADDWRRTLDRVQAGLGESGLTRQRLDDLRGIATEVLSAAEAAREDAEAQRRPLADQLAALGPAPAKGQPAESLDVANQRRQLANQMAVFDTRMKQAELTVARAGALQRDVARVGSEQLAQRLLLREPPPLSPSVVAAAAGQLGRVLAAMANAPLDWWQSTSFAKLNPLNFGWLGLLLLIALAAAWPLRNWLLRRYGHVPDIAEPSYARRSLAVAVEGFARGFLPAVGLLALTGVVFGDDLANDLFGRMVGGAVAGVVFFSLTTALVRAALAPEAPNWRIVPFDADSSRIIAQRLVALAAVTATALAIGIALGQFRDESRELFRLIGLVIDTSAAFLGLTLLQRRLWRLDDAETQAKPDEGGPHEAAFAAPKRASLFWPILRGGVALALLCVPVLLLLGYSNLATHIVSRVVATGLLFGFFLLLRALIREVFEVFIAPESVRSARLRRALTLSEQGSRILIFWLTVALDLVLILPGMAIALRVWGVPGGSIGLWIGNVLQGFEIGNLRFSLGDIALAIVIFVGFLALTRLFQRLLREKLLPQTRLDPGVRHSLAAMVGYLGFILAGASAISALGLNLANLAIIAGALSVGIGFGLQNIVNNFVSGLILLIERPIKVGDWVVVGQHQGYVTRISVRATEIETFERASVIVPNSELLSSAVVNWTHRDKYGRIEIKVGVAYGTDTAKVREILLACARDHRDILAWPQPYVLFMNFGADALEFELRGYVADVEKSMHISSDLHFAIDKEFRAAGIEIPYAHRDLTIRNVGQIARAISAAANGATAAQPASIGGDGGASASPPSHGS